METVLSLDVFKHFTGTFHGTFLGLGYNESTSIQAPLLPLDTLVPEGTQSVRRPDPSCRR